MTAEKDEQTNNGGQGTGLSEDALKFLRDALSQDPQAKQVPGEEVISGQVQDGEFD